MNDTQNPQSVASSRLEELHRQVRQGQAVVAVQGVILTVRQAPAATRVPPGTFHITIDQLRNQVRQGQAVAGPTGIQPPSNAPAATKVPKGTFHHAHTS
jgi:hypothetical protein